MALTSISMSHLSLKYYTVPVSSPHDPTSDTVQMAFMPTATQVPGPSDLVTGSWTLNPASLLYPWNARCLVGPGGAVTLGIGTWVAYLKVTDSPEIPFDIVGYLSIT